MELKSKKIGQVNGELFVRNLQTKAQGRMKMLPLIKTITDDKQISRKVHNKEQQNFQKKQNSFTHNGKRQAVNQKYRYQSLMLQNQSDSKVNASFNVSEQHSLKIHENKSVQYSEREQDRDFMNRSIQYSQQEGFICDFGIQINDGSIPKQVSYQFVQTENVQLKSKSRQKISYMLDQQVQANIELKKPIRNFEAQTQMIEKIDQNQGTDVITMITKTMQFPQEIITKNNMNIYNTIDEQFIHLYQKRRNLLDHNSYSIDRFQQKHTKYKWIGRANINDSIEQLTKKIMIECLVFSVYRYFGIKTAQKKLSYQKCSNVIGDRLKQASIHILTMQNPELQYMHQFEEYLYSEDKFPISQQLTYRNSKQICSFNKYGHYLAIAYFLNDFQIYQENYPHTAMVISNQEVKEIHKLSALEYEIHSNLKIPNNCIAVSKKNQKIIKIDRLSQAVQLQFISQLCKIVNEVTLKEVIKNITNIFIESTIPIQSYNRAIESTGQQRIEITLVQQFIKMLENRYERINQLYRYKLYTYNKYHSLTPMIRYKLPFEFKIDRKLQYGNKMISVNELLKHVRNKDNIVIITGQSGSGKRTLLELMINSLHTQKTSININIITIMNITKQFNKAGLEISEIMKNIIFINYVNEEQQNYIIEFIHNHNNMHKQLSYCIFTINQKSSIVFQNRFSTLNIVGTKLICFNREEIQIIVMKSTQNHTVTDKKQFLDLALQSISHIDLLSNAYYLSYFCKYLSHQSKQNIIKNVSNLSKFMLLREQFMYCVNQHGQEMKNMGITIKDTLDDLRHLAFQCYHQKNTELHEQPIFLQTIDKFKQAELISNQLIYYPINLEYNINKLQKLSKISNKNKSLLNKNIFIHQQFYNYFLIQAYSYYIEKSYKNLYMQKLYNNNILMNLMQQRYKYEGTYQQLLQVIYESKKYYNITQQSSNSITLLGRLGYIFSNLNFDNTLLSLANLSSCIFYNCSFRNCNLQSTILYHTQFINCNLQSALMTETNFYQKKYQIQFTALTTSLSVDGENLAFGCGNYLIIVSTATGKQIKKIQAHIDVIRTVKYTKNGNSLITIADDKTLRIWDVRNYKSVVFKLPQKGTISFSNQTETIASIVKNILNVWNIKSMANQAICDGHNDLITCVNFSNDGYYILTGSKDNTLRLWNIRGVQQHIYIGHELAIIVVKIAYNFRTCISSSKDKSIIIWQISTQKRIISRKFDAEIIELCLDNKQKYVIATFINDSSIIILDFITLETIINLKGHNGRILSINFDTNYIKLISLSKDRTVRIWQFNKIMQTQNNNNNKKNNKMNKKYILGKINKITYSYKMKQYATSYQNGIINLWNTQNNELIDTLISHQGNVKCLCYDLNGKLYSGGSDGILRIWNLAAKKKQPRILEILSSEMIELKLSQKNRIIAMSSTSNELVLYDFTGIKLILSTRQQGRINTICWNKNQKIMAIGGNEKYIVLYEINQNNNTIHRLEQLGQQVSAIHCLTFYNDQIIVCALSNGGITLWNYLKAVLIKKIENVSPIHSLLSFQQKLICFASQDGKCRIIDMQLGREIRVFKYFQYCTTMDNNYNDSILYVGTNGGNIILWNLNVLKENVQVLAFQHKAIDRAGHKMVIVEGVKSLAIRDLYMHTQNIMDCHYLSSAIEGVCFDGNNIVILLKNGVHCDLLGNPYHLQHYGNQQGEMVYLLLRNKSNIYKSIVKKIRNIQLPTQKILQELIQ